MATFALACEGITDQIVIENILCGFYKDHDDLDEDIQPLQPPYDNFSKSSTDIPVISAILTEQITLIPQGYIKATLLRHSSINKTY